MKLSRNFLKDYVDIKDINIYELADKMVKVGNEFETIRQLANSDSLVVGKVIECEKHSESDKLSVCKVDVKDEVLQIVCGAPNVREGLKVVVAKVGAVLPGNFEIKKASILNTESNGMICSLLELGIDKAFLSQEDIDGIHELNNEAKVGEDPNKYLMFDDYIIDFDLTANRGDLLSVIGMAYEVSAIYDKKVILPDISYKETKDDINEKFTLNVETKNCMAYLAKMVSNIEIKDSPQFIKSRLIASGIRPINNVVDISNYVMLETGQPLHFFDADKLNKDLLITMGDDFKKIKTLDTVERDVNKEDILVTDTKNPIALAGVMGSYDTEVTSNTKNILIESAQFNKTNVRLTSKRVLRSEASSRFEKGIDPNMTLFALKRACHLLEKYAKGKVNKGILMHDELNKDDKVIEVKLSEIQNTLGMEIMSKEVVSILNRLGFIVKNKGHFEVHVPSRRGDIEIKEDIIEEVGRINGYEKLIGNLPNLETKRGGYSKKSKLLKDTEDLLSSFGLDQAINYTLVKDLDDFSFDLDKIIISNPMSEDKKVCRQNLTSSLFENYKYNSSRGAKNINLFEVGDVYFKNNGYDSKILASGLMSGTYLLNEFQGKVVDVDFYLVKGIVTEFLDSFGLENRYEFIEEDVPGAYHPYRSVRINVNKNHVGYLGQVHPSLSKNEVYIFEIDLSKLMELKVRGVKYKEISKFPTTTKDLAFIMPKDIKSSEIERHIRKVCSRYLKDLYVFDVYDFNDGNKSLAFSLTFEDKTQTLSDDFVNDLLNKIIKNVEEKTSAKLRDK